MSDKPLTRAFAARMLRCTISHVRRLEREGRLHPTIDPESGWRIFSIADVEAYRLRVHEHHRRRRSRARGRDVLDDIAVTKARGELAARLFELFKQGMSFADVCIAAHAPPDVVRELHREFVTSYEEGERQRLDAEARERAEREDQRYLRLAEGDRRAALGLQLAEIDAAKVDATKRRNGAN